MYLIKNRLIQNINTEFLNNEVINNVLKSIMRTIITHGNTLEWYKANHY